MAHEIAAERKRRRIAENMANAPTVDAVKSDFAANEKESIRDAVCHDESSDDDQDRPHISDDPMGCIEPTKEMMKHQTEVDSLRVALNQLENALDRVPVGSTERLQMSTEKDDLQSELKNLKSAFALERNKAKSMYWADRTNRIIAKDQGRALGSVPFCEGEVMVGGFSKHEEDIEQEYILTERSNDNEEQARLAAIRQEQEKLAELEWLEKRRIETERSKQERLAEEARIEEILEHERLAAVVKQERVFADQTQKDREAAQLEEERLAVEADRLKQEKPADEARLEAERLENERLAAEAARQAEFERFERERLAAEEAKKRLEKETKEAIDLAMQVAADKTDFLSSDVRFAAGRLKNDLLAHYISVAPEMVEHSDKSGWRPIHEAARAGNLVGIQLLISAGCDLTSRTGRKGNGGTALWWAIQRFGEDHDAVKLLRYHGALDAGPTT